MCEQKRQNMNGDSSCDHADLGKLGGLVYCTCVKKSTAGLCFSRAAFMSSLE